MPAPIAFGVSETVPQDAAGARNERPDRAPQRKIM